MPRRSPTEVLEEEHRVIAKVVGAVPVFADWIGSGVGVEVETLRRVVGFMSLYADRLHHGKEEEILFPALAHRGVPVQGCPIGGLTMEHTRGRALVKGLLEAAEAWGRGAPGARESLLESLRGIAQLYPGHIWREDYLLFPMTNKVMSGPELEELAAAFEKVDERIGRDEIRRQEELAEQLARTTQKP